MATVESLDTLLTKCLHCGLCLPTCPTYAATGREDASPRGRIRLMRSHLAGDIDTTPAFVEAMSFCLDCQACETACPAGVHYGELVEEARDRISTEGREPLRFRLEKRFLLRWFASSPFRRTIAEWVLRIYDRSGMREAIEQSGLLSLFPSAVESRHALLPVPDARRFSSSVPEFTASRGEAKGTVALLTGCIMDFAFAELHRDMAEVLLRNGYNVLVTKRQPCCGSMHAHFGERGEARSLARGLIDHLDSFRFDWFVADSAGCAAFIKEYGSLLADDPAYADRARNLSDRCREITEFLVRQGFVRPAGTIRTRVTYHDPCHLVHTQHVSEQPRTLLRSLPGIDFVELPEATWCCGSAGLYNALRPEDGRMFLERKIANIASVDPEIVSTANPGCHVQIAAGLRHEGKQRRVMHPVSLLNLSYREAETAGEAGFQHQHEHL